MRRSAIAIVSLVLLLPAGGALLQGGASTLDGMRLAPPGEIVTVGGAGLHVFCSGPTDAPPVFLENGMGVVSDAWVRVQHDLSEDHRVCRYDRAGTGHSARFDGPKDASAAVDRLLALTEEVGMDRPMILVGHSYGGLVARVFAHRHPERVAGLVLVDSAHEEMGERLPPAGRDMVDDILSALVQRPEYALQVADEIRALARSSN
jgi:pimeloyl-ACP methyl ester carboxylesterase